MELGTLVALMFILTLPSANELFAQAGKEPQKESQPIESSKRFSERTGLLRASRS